MEKIVFVKWRLKASEVSRIAELLPKLAESTRHEQGNISYQIYQSESNPCELILHEHYVDAAAAESHKQSEHYQRIVVNEILPQLKTREVISVTKLV